MKKKPKQTKNPKTLNWVMWFKDALKLTSNFFIFLYCHLVSPSNLQSAV